MNITILEHDFDWQRWSSTDDDIVRLGRIQAARILFEIFLINTFENELLRLKDQDCIWGPVHTSVGQEAIAAAVMAALGKTDKITGSHRAHHHFLAKALNYVLSDDWDPTENALPAAGQEVLQKTLAEIMGLGPGYCRGRGGSMHLRYAEAGILGTNAIVAGGVPVATGAAYSEKYRGTKNIIVCFAGDGAVNQGAFHESLNLAGLWKLPIIYVIENNKFAVATRSENASAVKELSRRAAAYAMAGRIVEGNDVAAIFGVIREAAKHIYEGGCPCLVEIKCYRHYHHAGGQPGSAYGYRKQEEELHYIEADALRTFPKALETLGLLTTVEIDRFLNAAREAVLQAVEFCTVKSGRGCRVRQELWPNLESAVTGMRSDGRELEGIRYSKRSDFKAFEEIRYSDAIAKITGRWMEKDKYVVELGEEVANFGGGAYGATKHLPQKYPGQVINTPISEAGFVGLACGAAINGLRSVVEIMFPDFALVAADQLFNQIGKLRYMYGGNVDIPLVVRTRIAMGCGYGAQHSMDPVRLFALFPGWRVVAPSDAFDYIGLFNTAMTCCDPVVFLEHHSLYNKKFRIPRGNIDYYVPFEKARVVREGDDITVLSYGSMTGRLEGLAESLKSVGISAQIIDLRTLDLPGIDYETIGVSLRKTGVVVIVEEAPRPQGIGTEIAAEITRRFFDDLDSPPVCSNSQSVPPPVSRVLEKEVLLSDQQITETIEAVAERRFV